LHGIIVGDEVKINFEIEGIKTVGKYINH